MRSRLPVLGLVACTVILCGAGWHGIYRGNAAGDPMLVLKEDATGGVRVDVLRVPIGDAALCQLRVEACPVVADADRFRAGPCTAELAGTQGDTCTGTVDLHVQGKELANNGTVVTSLELQTTLDDWPVVLQRRACGLGFELAALVPLLRLARRVRRRRSRGADPSAQA